MADVKISNMPNAGVLNGSEVVPLVQAGANVKTNLRNAVGGACIVLTAAITGGVLQQDIAHGLGRNPLMMMWWLRCTGSFFQFSIGDLISFATGVTNTGLPSQVLPLLTCNSSFVTVNYTESIDVGDWTIIDTFGVNHAIDISKFEFVVVIF